MGGSRRNRQPDAHMCEASEDSSESGDKINLGDNTRGKRLCPHADKALTKFKVTHKIKKLVLQTKCADCEKLNCNETPSDEEKSLPYPLWICLFCDHQACGRDRKSHAFEHFNSEGDSNHCVVANIERWNIYCYRCNTEFSGLHSQKLLEVVELARKTDFSPSTTTQKENSKKNNSQLSPVSRKAIPLPFSQKDVDNENVEKTNSPANGLTRVVGLTNLGNTCFFNAVLQCLSQTPFLVKVLEDLQEPGEKFVLPGGKCKISDDSEEMELPPIEGTLEGWGAFTAILCKTLKAMQTMQTRQVYVPNELLANFKKKTMQCMDGGQHDSHELLRHLLELVRNEDLRRYQTVILKQIGIGVSIKANCANDIHKAHLKFYGRQASSRLLGSEPVFRGVLVSTLTCLECNHSSRRTETFLDLSLPVMSEKPQSPIFKKHNMGFDHSSDSMGKKLSSEDITRNQRMEKTKKLAQSRNKTATGNNSYGQLSRGSELSEERRISAVESEGDADIEDNVSPPEIVESGNSSERISSLINPIFPDDLTKNTISKCDVNAASINGNFPSSPDDSITKSAKLVSEVTNQEFKEKRSTDLSLNVDRSPLEASNASWMASPTIENSNELRESFGVSPSTSWVVNSELSSEEATVSSLSSPITSKDSPMSPLSSIIDEKPEVEKNSTQCLPTEAQTPRSNLSKDAADEKTEALMNELRLMIENHSSRESNAADRGAPEHRASENQPNKPTASPTEKPEVTSENGVADITEELSKITVSPCRKMNCYDIKDGDCSIQSCLNQFTAVEYLSGSNKVCCVACTARENKGKEGSTKMVCTPSTKQYLISQVPAVLILHLKRFQSLRMGFRKVAKHVDFPLLLDLAPVCIGGGKPIIYSLYGVVAHSGTLHGGHYVAYVKTRPPLTPDDPRWAFLPSKDCKESAENLSSSNSDAENDERKDNCNVKPPPGYWYYISDSRVMEVDEAAVLRIQAYILFYERIQ